MAAFVLRDLKCTPETGNTKRRGHGVGAGGAFRSRETIFLGIPVLATHAYIAGVERWLGDQEHLLPFAALLEDMNSYPGTGPSLAARSQLLGILAPEDREPSSGLCVHLNTHGWIQIKTFFFSGKSTLQTPKYPASALTRYCHFSPLFYASSFEQKIWGEMRPSILLSVGIFPFLRE